MDQVSEFINNPLVVGVYSILVLSLIDLALAIWRSIQDRVFDLQKLPQLLDTVVLRKVVPLAGLGVASYFVTEPSARSALSAAYTGLALTVVAAEVQAILTKITGSYTATNTEQDRGLTKQLP